MNILFILHTPKLPNTSVYQDYEQRIAYFGKRGHQCAILAPQDFPWVSQRHSRWLPLLFPFVVAQFLLDQRHGYDLVVFHSYSGWVVNALRPWVPGFRRFKVVTAFHGLEPLYYAALQAETRRLDRRFTLRYRLVHGGLLPKLMRLACRRSDRVTCLNRKEVAYLVENGWASPSRVFLLPHGVPRGFFIQRTYREQAIRLLFVGQWDIRKGTRYLTEAFRALACQEERLQLWCVGTMAGEETVRAEFPANLRRQIQVWPRVDQEGLLEIHREADLFLFPTLFEGCSTALLEAMASALPIVTTSAGAAPDLLVSEENALLVPEADARALAAAVYRLMNDRGARQRLGQKAQQDARPHLLESAYERIGALYLELLQCHPPG